jgi:hypothetical protein
MSVQKAQSDGVAEGIMNKDDLGRSLRAFFDVPAKLWVDLLAAMRVVPYPLAREVHRAVDVGERTANSFREDLRATANSFREDLRATANTFREDLRVFLIFLGVFLVWRELRRR